MGFYANKILLLILAAVASGQIDEEEQVYPDNVQSDSQSVYKFVNLPGRSIKYISPLGPSSIYSPKIRTYVKYRRPVFPIKARPSKLMFTPNPKFTSYALYRESNHGSNNLFSKRPAVFERYGGQFYKPIHPNFNTELAIDVTNPNPNNFKGDLEFYLQKAFLESASQKQIEQYLEDLHKEEDEKIELQLLNDPNPEAKGKYQQFLKAKEDEKIEKEYLENLQKADKETGSNYAPIRIQEQDVVVKKPDTPGLRHFRTLHSDDPSAYELELTL